MKVLIGAEALFYREEESQKGREHCYPNKHSRQYYYKSRVRSQAFYNSPGRDHRWRPDLAHQDEVYRLAPTIPNFGHANSGQFSRLRITLENILLADASEMLKFQIITDHDTLN